MRKLTRLSWLLIVLAGCAPQGAGQADVVLRADFRSDPNASGWLAEVEYPGAKTPFGGQWVHEANQEFIRIWAGMWTSPQFAVKEFEFYRLTFTSRAAKDGYWAMRFFDANGVELLADNYANVYASDDWAPNNCCIMARAGAVRASVGFRPNGSEVAIGEVKVARIGRPDALAWADAMYKTLPPVDYTPEADRFKNLPLTMEKLRAGRPLRIAVLGDSIANDMSNSLFDLLIERMYPRSHVTLIHAVRGNTGCWWFEKDNMVKPFVLDHAPDLVVISGISHQTDANAIRNVIKQVRAQQPDVEFLVTTGAMIEPGMNYGFIQKGLQHPTPDVRQKHRDAETKFYNDLAAVRDADHFATLDLRDVWENYLAASPRPPEYFHRDFIHSNDRGKQILGRILTRYFQPE